MKGNKEEIAKRIETALGVELKSLKKMSNQDLETVDGMLANPRDLVQKLGKAKYSQYAGRASNWLDEKIAKARVISEMLDPNREQ